MLQDIIYLLSLREFQLVVGTGGVYLYDKNPDQRDFCASLHVGMQEDTRVCIIISNLDELPFLQPNFLPESLRSS